MEDSGAALHFFYCLLQIALGFGLIKKISHL